MKRQRQLSLEEFQEQWSCSISSMPMVDPVITEDGHSYERQHIKAWFNKDKNKIKISPKTNLQLKKPTLIPNIALKNVIQKFNKQIKYQIEKLKTQNTQLQQKQQQNKENLHKITKQTIENQLKVQKQSKQLQQELKLTSQKCKKVEQQLRVTKQKYEQLLQKQRQVAVIFESLQKESDQLQLENTRLKSELVVVKGKLTQNQQLIASMEEINKLKLQITELKVFENKYCQLNAEYEKVKIQNKDLMAQNFSLNLIIDNFTKYKTVYEQAKKSLQQQLHKMLSIAAEAQRMKIDHKKESNVKNRQIKKLHKEKEQLSEQNYQLKVLYSTKLKQLSQLSRINNHKLKIKEDDNEKQQQGKDDKKYKIKDDQKQQKQQVKQNSVNQREAKSNASTKNEKNDFKLKDLKQQSINIFSLRRIRQNKSVDKMVQEKQQQQQKCDDLLKKEKTDDLLQNKGIQPKMIPQQQNHKAQKQQCIQQQVQKLQQQQQSQQIQIQVQNEKSNDNQNNINQKIIQSIKQYNLLKQGQMKEILPVKEMASQNVPRKSAPKKTGVRLYKIYKNQKQEGYDFRSDIAQMGSQQQKNYWEDQQKEQLKNQQKSLYEKKQEKNFQLDNDPTIYVFSSNELRKQAIKRHNQEKRPSLNRQFIKLPEKIMIMPSEVDNYVQKYPNNMVVFMDENAELKYQKIKLDQMQQQQKIKQNQKMEKQKQENKRQKQQQEKERIKEAQKLYKFMYEDINPKNHRNISQFEGSKVASKLLKVVSGVNEKGPLVINQTNPKQKYQQKQPTLLIENIFPYQDYLMTLPVLYDEDRCKLDHSQQPIDFKQFLKHNWNALKYLNMSNCDIDDDSFAIFINHAAHFPNINFLLLWGNIINNLPENSLQKFPNLKTVYFSIQGKLGNPLNQKSKIYLQSFKKKHPKIGVHYEL